MRILTEYELSKILNRVEIDHAQKMKQGKDRNFNINAIYTIREIRNKINKYLDTKYEK